MGQAFDKYGDLLGGAVGDTKKEVFDKLNEQFKEASEIRVRSAEAMGRDRMLQFFTHSHLPDHLARVSLPFCQLAEEICATLPSNPERTVALRKLLEAKDCAVRALLYKS